MAYNILNNYHTVYITSVVCDWPGFLQGSEITKQEPGQDIYTVLIQLRIIRGFLIHQNDLKTQ